MIVCVVYIVRHLGPSSHGLTALLARPLSFPKVSEIDSLDLKPESVVSRSQTAPECKVPAWTKRRLQLGDGACSAHAR